jgi:hypothetical protein
MAFSNTFKAMSSAEECIKSFLEDDAPAVTTARKSPPDLSKEFESISDSSLVIPPEVKEMTVSIFSELGQGFKGRKKRRQFFYALYQAFHHCGREISPAQLQVHFGFNGTEVTRCMKEFGVVTKSESKKVYVHYPPEYYIENYMKTGYGEEDRRPILSQEKPQKLAVAAIQCALDEYGVTYSKQYLASLAGISLITADPMYNKVKKLLTEENG